MITFTELNTYSQTSVDYETIDQQISIANGVQFTTTVPTWEFVRTLGSLTGNGVAMTYDVSSTTNASVSFPNSGDSNNTLTVTNPSTGVYTISGILDIIDYTAAVGNIVPDSGHTGNVTYSITATNDNVANVEIVIDYVGTP